MRTTDPPASPDCREVRDRRGRVYRVGESDTDLLGCGRIRMVVLSWVGMAGVGCAGAAYAVAGAGDPRLWVLAQAAVAFPAGWLRDGGRLPARTAVTGGALGMLFACLALTFAPGLAVAGAVGGAGAGLVCATCLTSPGRWCPERRGGPTGFVVSGCAVAAVPLLLGLEPAGLAATGAGVCLVVAVAGRFLREPPRDWWPPHPHPLRVPDDPVARRVLAKNPPAVRQHTAGEAARTPVWWLTGLCLLGAAGITVLDVHVLTPSGRAAVLAAALAAGGAGVLSDLAGRRVTLVAALAVLGAVQFALPAAGRASAAWPAAVCAGVVGLAASAVLTLVTAMTADHFGDNHVASVNGLPAGVLPLPLLLGSPHGAFVLAGCSGLACAALALFLTPPGRLGARRIVPNPHPLGEEMAT
ncbi:MFS transporter [Streptomyces sp. Ru71]|uniref:MFS transporter n=1 Tax=Streptomyces sp. Ru71 TaxID=2080746 RepID=UPI0015E31815|nr:MFS transporter [Streptomyces sp. Ru71]